MNIRILEIIANNIETSYMDDYSKMQEFKLREDLSIDENEKRFWENKQKEYFKNRIYQSYQTEAYCDRLRIARGLAPLPTNT